MTDFFFSSRRLFSRTGSASKNFIARKGLKEISTVLKIMKKSLKKIGVLLKKSIFFNGFCSSKILPVVKLQSREMTRCFQEERT